MGGANMCATVSYPTSSPYYRGEPQVSVRCLLYTVGCLSPAVFCCLLPGVCCRVSTVYCLLSTVYCLLSTVYCLLSTVYCLLSTVCCLLSTVYCLLSTVYCLLSAVYCLLSTVCLRKNDIYLSFTRRSPKVRNRGRSLSQRAPGQAGRTMRWRRADSRQKKAGSRQ
jgi:hypothetical protein